MRRRPENMSHRIHWWRCRRFVRWIGRQTSALSSSVRIVRVELLYSNPGYFHLIPSPSGGWWRWWCATTKGRIPNTGSYLRKWDHLSMKYQRGCSSFVSVLLLLIQGYLARIDYCLMAIMMMLFGELSVESGFLLKPTRLWKSTAAAAGLWVAGTHNAVA